MGKRDLIDALRGPWWWSQRDITLRHRSNCFPPCIQRRSRSTALFKIVTDLTIHRYYLRVDPARVPRRLQQITFPQPGRAPSNTYPRVPNQQKVYHASRYVTSPARRSLVIRPAVTTFEDGLPIVWRNLSGPYMQVKIRYASCFPRY